MSTALTTHDPLALLTEEHALFRDETRTFLEMMERYAGLLGTVPLDPAPVAAFASFLAEDVDRRHGGKEEQGLFPVLARRVGSEEGPVALLRSEHDELREHQRTLASAARHLASDAEDAPIQMEVLRGAGEVHRFLGLHIDKEEEILFPMAREVLTEKDLEEVREVFHRLEEERGPVTPRPGSAGTGGGRPLPPFCAAGRARRDRAERAPPSVVPAAPDPRRL